MYGRYDLDVTFNGVTVFRGSFVSINRAIKVASCFDAECDIRLYDSLCARNFGPDTVDYFIEEFLNGEILL